jgi:hypothetical protein
MEDLVVGFPKGGRHHADSYLNSCLPLVLGKVTHIYRQPRHRGSLVTREIDDIGGFKAKMGLARAGWL